MIGNNMRLKICVCWCFIRTRIFVNWYKYKVTRFANTMKTRAMYFLWPKLKSTTSSVILQNYCIVFKTKSRVYKGWVSKNVPGGKLRFVMEAFILKHVYFLLKYWKDTNLWLIAAFPSPFYGKIKILHPFFTNF